MKKILISILILLMASISQATNVDLKVDGVQYQCVPSVVSQTYTVTVTNRTPKGGTISPMNQIIPQGGTATFNITVNPGAAVQWVTPGTVQGSIWTIQNVIGDIQASISFMAIPHTQCQSGDYTSPQAWTASTGPIGVVGQKDLYWCIPASTKSMAVNANGITNETSATLTWTFPDGRVFPIDPNGRLLIGTGTAMVNLYIYGSIYPFGNIPDLYIPQGRHKLTIIGTFTGYLSIDF